MRRKWHKEITSEFQKMKIKFNQFINKYETSSEIDERLKRVKFTKNISKFRNIHHIFTGIN